MADLLGTEHDETLTGGDGDDSLYGNGGDDTLIGGGGNDLLYGGFGTDILVGGAGNDQISGNAAVPEGGGFEDDVAVFSGNRADYDIIPDPNSPVARYLVVDRRPGSPDGQDLVWYVSIFRFADRDVPISEIGGVVTGDDGPNFLGGNVGPDRISGGGSVDSLSGNAGNDELTGGAGDDFISGGSGVDTAIYGGQSTDYKVTLLIGGSVEVRDNRTGSPDGTDILGPDVEKLRFADQTVTIATEGVFLLGTSGPDTLIGTDGNDQIGGDDGDDTLIGGAGHDRLFGGFGDDTLVGGPGNDVVQGTVFSFGTVAVFSGNRSDYLITRDFTWRDGPRQPVSTAYLVRDLREGSPDGLDQVVNIDTFRFADGDVPGLAIGAVYVGGALGEQIFGTAGADQMFGGGGNDLLVANAGNDELIGGPGDDALVGDTGIDTAVYGGRLGDYSVALLRDGDLEVRDNRPNSPDGTDRLHPSVELLAFADGIRVARDLAVTRDAPSDFNGDGRSDVVWLHSSGAFTWWAGQADGTLLDIGGHGANPVDSSWRIVGIGDFDGDGNDDLLWRHSSGALAEWQGQLPVPLSEAPPPPDFVNVPGIAANAVDNSWSVVGTADYNGDGRDDILWRHSSGAITQWLARPDGSFVNNSVIAGAVLDNSWKVVASGDFTGDGVADLLWRHNDGALVEWRGTTSGAFANAGSVMAGNTGNVIGSGDFNDDGRDDILTRALNGSITEWIAQAGGQFAPVTPTAQALDSNWEVVAIGDYDGDGFEDIFWRHGSGANVVWLGAPDGQFPYAVPANAIDISWQVQDPDIFIP